MADYIFLDDEYKQDIADIMADDREREHIMFEQFNGGEFVACDFCNEGEETFGGVLIGSYAICGDCAKKITEVDEIDERFDENKTFRQNVLEYRQRVYGTRDAITQIWFG